MADRGQITGGTLDGPLALDNAVSRDAALIKHIDSPVAGDADIMLVPDMNEESSSVRVTEDVHLPFKSVARAKNPGGDTVGVMRTCGHDAHMAMLFELASVFYAAERLGK